MDSGRSDARRNIDAILLAARDAFADDPRAELNAIAVRAGVHRVTLYRHFPTREDLLARLHESYLDDAEAVIRDTDPEAEDLLGEIARLTRRLYEVNVTWQAFAWAPAYSTAAQLRRGEMTAANVALFQAAAARGVLRADLSLRQILATWGAPILFLTSRICDGSWTLDEVVDHTMLLLTAP